MFFFSFLGFSRIVLCLSSIGRRTDYDPWISRPSIVSWISQLIPQLDWLEAVKMSILKLAGKVGINSVALSLC